MTKEVKNLLACMDIDYDFEDEDTDLDPPNCANVEQAALNLFQSLGLPLDTEVAENMVRILIYNLLSGLYTPPPTEGELLVDCSSVSQKTIAGPFPVSTICKNTMLMVTGTCVITIMNPVNVIGIDKYQRLIDWVSARPCTQENLTNLLCEHFHRITKGYVQVQLELNHISFKLGESRKASQITVAEKPV